MVFRRAAHAVYDTGSHLVWSPKYRKRILDGALAERVGEMFREIAATYDITIDEMEVSVDQGHIFCSFPPRYSIAQISTRFKSLSARASFREYPQVQRQLWGGEFWEDGYFARTVGNSQQTSILFHSFSRKGVFFNHLGQFLASHQRPSFEAQNMGGEILS